MALYAQSVVGGCIGLLGFPGPVCDIKAPASHKSSLVEICIFVARGNASATIGLSRANTELFQLGSAAFASEENDLVSETRIATAWSVPPVLSTIFLRRSTCLNSTGQGVIWGFPRGIYIAAGNSLIVSTDSERNLYNITAEIDE